MHTPFENPVFSDALVILGAAGIVIPAFARLKINPVIGFILVGMLVGPSGLGSIVDQFPWLYHITITDREAIDPFAEFGIVMLLFTIGLELSFKRLWAMRVQVFGLGSAQLLASGLVIGFALNLIGQPLAGALGLGMALALSSTALVLPMVGTTGPVGRSALAMLIFEDLALVPIIFALGALAPRAEAAGLDGLVETLWLGGLTIVIMLLAGRYLLPYLFAQAARTKSPELFLAACLLVVITASVATAAAGLSPIVGALIAGVMIAETEYGGEVEIITAPFKGLALGVFLITVGMSVDLRVVAANWQSLAIAVVGVCLIKAVVTGGLLRLVGARRGVAAETGVLMASPAETTLIVLAAAVQAQLIQSSTAQFWQIVTAIGLTITPLLAKLGHVIATRIDMRASESARARRGIGGCGQSGAVRLWPGGRDRLGHARQAQPALCCDRIQCRCRRRSKAQGRADPIRRCRAARIARPAAARPCQGADLDDGRSGARRAHRPPRRGLGARSHDHRPRARCQSRGGTLPRRGNARGARGAGKLAAAVRGGAGRSGHCDGPGDRLDPREARRIAPQDHAGRRAFETAAAQIG